MQAAPESSALIAACEEAAAAIAERDAAAADEEAALADVRKAHSSKKEARGQAASVIEDTARDPYASSQGSSYYNTAAQSRRKEAEWESAAAADAEDEATQAARVASRRKAAALKNVAAAEALVERHVAAAAAAQTGGRGLGSPPGSPTGCKLPRPPSPDARWSPPPLRPSSELPMVPKQFRYDCARHATAAASKASGCRMVHLSLDDVAKSAGFAYSSLGPTKFKLKKAAEKGDILGTREIYCTRTDAPSNKTARKTWWWHQGDPQLYKVRRVMQGLSVEGWP